MKYLFAYFTWFVNSHFSHLCNFSFLPPSPRNVCFKRVLLYLILLFARTWTKKWLFWKILRVLNDLLFICWRLKNCLVTLYWLGPHFFCFIPSLNAKAIKIIFLEQNFSRTFWIWNLDCRIIVLVTEELQLWCRLMSCWQEITEPDLEGRRSSRPRSLKEQCRQGDHFCTTIFLRWELK